MMQRKADEDVKSPRHVYSATRVRTVFKQSDVRRLVAGARQAGLNVEGLTVDKDGKITVTIGRPTEAAECDKGDTKPWDDKYGPAGA